MGSISKIIQEPSSWCQKKTNIWKIHPNYCLNALFNNKFVLLIIFFSNTIFFFLFHLGNVGGHCHNYKPHTGLRSQTPTTCSHKGQFLCGTQLLMLLELGLLYWAERGKAGLCGMPCFELGARRLCNEMLLETFKRLILKGKPDWPNLLTSKEQTAEPHHRGVIYKAVETDISNHWIPFSLKLLDRWTPSYSSVSPTKASSWYNFYVQKCHHVVKEQEIRWQMRHHSPWLPGRVT